MSGEVVLGGTQKRHSGRGHDDRLWLGEQVLAKRNRGSAMPVAAAELGISVKTAYRCLKLALAVRVPLEVDEYRRQQNDRLDETQRQIAEQIDAANELARRALEAEPPNVALFLESLKARDRAISLQLTLDQRRARLNGLDAPVQVEATVTQIDPREEELAEMVREAKAAAANAAAQEASDA
jgi:hypothetical protein